MKRLAMTTVLASTAVLGAVSLCAGSVLAATGQITRADATADWSRGSVAGSVAGLPPSVYAFYNSFAAAYVVPNGFACHPQEIPGYFPVSPYPGAIRQIWTSAPADQNPSFDLPYVPLDNGRSPRICLYAVYKALTLPGVNNATLLASRSFAVPPPAQSTPPTTQSQPPVTLSRAAALSKARSALKKRFGRTYTRAERKRLSCARRSATRRICAFSFRYKAKRRAGTVRVQRRANGTVAAKTRLI